MEEVKVFLRKDVTDFLEELIFRLFQKEYFGFRESAQEYVQKIYDFIEFSLPLAPHKKTPERLVSFGSHYVFYKANSNTTWYIFFEKNENRFLVTFITNSHSELMKYL